MPKKRAAKTSLSKPFNDASRQPAHRFERAHGLKNIAGRYKFPRNQRPSDYEDQYTFEWHIDGKGIARRPKILKGLRLPALSKIKSMNEAVNIPVFKIRLERAWKSLCRINPKVRKIKVDKKSADELYQALFGVTSCFNVDDINFFMALKRQGVLAAQHAAEMPEIKPLKTWIQARTNGEDMFWVASEKTLKKIKSQMENIEKKKAKAPASNGARGFQGPGF